MTTQKDFKRLVRARMVRTGESYTSARSQIIKRRALSLQAEPESEPRAESSGLRNTVVSPRDYAGIAGMSDASLKKATGCNWEKWVKSLDHNGAQQMTHTQIAEIVSKKYKAGPWWSQMVTVGYERIRGLRTRGQQRNGTWQATKSRTFGVPVDVLFDAWTDSTTRKKWLNVSVKVRKATKPKSVRLDWTDGTIVPVMFAAKAKGKSSVAVEHVKLASKEDAARLKAEWTERFDALAAILKGGT